MHIEKKELLFSALLLYLLFLYRSCAKDVVRQAKGTELRTNML